MAGSVEAVPPRSAVRLSAAKRFPEQRKPFTEDLHAASELAGMVHQ